MREKMRSPHTYNPDTLASLLLFRKRHPNAVLYSGGTYLLKYAGVRAVWSLPEIIFLGDVGELKRINRTDRYLEIGAGVSLSAILATGRRILPKAFADCLESIGNPPVRNLATLGGNVCVRSERMDTFPLLSILDVRAEIRKAGSSKWLPLNRCLDGDGNFMLGPGETVTRFRIPYDDWDVELYKKYPVFENPLEGRFIFCGLAKTQKNALGDIRFIFCLGRRQILRIRDVELELVGKSLPLSEKTVELALEEAAAYCGNLESALKDRDRERIFSALNLFLRRL